MSKETMMVMVDRKQEVGPVQKQKAGELLFELRVTSTRYGVTDIPQTLKEATPQPHSAK